MGFVRNNLGKTDRAKVIQMVGEDNVGIWLIAENIVHLEKVIMKVPTYVSWFAFSCNAVYFQFLIILTQSMGNCQKE